MSNAYHIEQVHILLDYQRIVKFSYIKYIKINNKSAADLQ